MIKQYWNNLLTVNQSKMLKTCVYTLLLAALTPIAQASEPAGKTILAKGDVKAININNNESRPLRRRSTIFDIDNITTGERSKAQFNMSDGGLITLKEKTEILIRDYQYNKENQKGSATIEIVNGGLRSLSGLIKKSGGDYQVKTPVGSIGIRGTHFAVEVIDELVYFSVFNGNIDINLANNEILSLGVNESFANASVDKQGNITRLKTTPPVIATGYSVDVSTINESEDNASTSADELAQLDPIELDPLPQNITIATDNSIYNESEWQGIDGSPLAELIAERSGAITYTDVFSTSILSSNGDVNNFAMTMTVDFDNASVPGGTLSFDDSQGEWFATYSGLINVDTLDLGITFASHNNKRADGTIFAGFSNGLNELTGGFSLQEVDDPAVNAGGSFKIKP